MASLVPGRTSNPNQLLRALNNAYTALQGDSSSGMVDLNRALNVVLVIHSGSMNYDDPSSAENSFMNVVYHQLKYMASAQVQNVLF